MAGHIGSAGNVSWNTPEWILEKVRRTFGGRIDLDPCSNEGSIVGARRSYMLPGQDGLVEPWEPAESVFVNPPFGRCHMHIETRAILADKAFQKLPEEERSLYRTTTIASWLARCVTSGDARIPTIGLVPAAVDTSAWQTYVAAAAAVCLLDGRVKFVGAKSCAPMPVAIVGWGLSPFTFHREWHDAGMVFQPERRAA